MATEPDVRSHEALIRVWYGRIHAYAWRMLGNRADADDATQEVVLRVLARLGSYDPARPFEPWIYAVATRSILNRLRAERTRTRHEAAVAPLPAPETTEGAVDRREREAIVHEGLQALDGQDRSLLTLHYYAGLSQRDIAEILEVPRTTVQARISRALDDLRAALGTAGHAAVLPGLEALMRDSVPLPVDEHAVARLIDLAGEIAAPCPVLGTATVGGLVVTKNLVLALALVALLFGGGGFVVGRELAADGGAEGDARDGRELARLREENRSLRAAAESSGSERPGLATATMPPPPLPPGSAPEAPVMAVPEATSPDEKGTAPKGPPDWSKFARLFAENLDGLAALAAADGREDLIPADRKAALYAVFAEYMRVCAEARSRTDSPFYDPDVLAGFAVALFGESLSLDDARRASLAEAVRQSLARHGGTAEAERGPLEAFDARERISEDLLTAAREGLDEKVAKRLEGVRPIAEALMLGGYKRIHLGMAAREGEKRGPEFVVAKWREAYGLDERQGDAVRNLAERYLRDAADVWRQRGYEATSATVSEEDRRAAEREMMRLQVAAEREILPLLSPEQRAKVRKELTTIVFVEPGSGVRTSITNAGGL